MSGFDKHLQKILKDHPEAASEYLKVLAELPIQTQLAILRRHRLLSQRGLARKLKVKQPHIARAESERYDPRVSSIAKAAKAIGCHLLIVPDEQLGRLTAA